jgi:hypothetical protein
MKKVLLPLLATAALVAPAAASAHHGWFGWHALLAKVSGTGTSFASASATASGKAIGTMNVTGTFSASISSDWTKATSHTGMGGTLSCAPATATLTITGAVATDTAKGSLTGKTCKWTPTTGSTVSAFFGRGITTGAGALASLTGSTEKAFLTQKSDGTVAGAVFAGMHSMMNGMFASDFAAREHDAANKTGHSDRG